MNHNLNSSKRSSGLTLVLGATGKTGRRIVERLENRGVATRLGSRASHPSFDWNDQGGWDAVLAGVTTAYISYAPDLAIPGATQAIQDFVKQAVKHGVSRMVLLSGRGEDEAQRCERIIQDSGIEWTVVRCSWFNQNFSEGEFLDMVLSGAITLPAGDIPEPFADADDIADVAVAALIEDGHASQIYEVTGPRMLTFAQAAAEISRASGRKIQYMQIPHEAFLAGIAESGAADDIAWLLGYLFTSVLDGRNAYVCDGVQRALGRKPTDFAEYASRVSKTGIWDLPSTLQRAAAL